MRDASEPDRVLRGGLIPPARFDQIGGGAGHDDRRPVDRGAGRQRLVVVDRRLQRTVMANEMAGPLRRFRRRRQRRSEEHTSELQSLMRISYAVFCLKKKNTI